MKSYDYRNSMHFLRDNVFIQDDLPFVYRQNIDLDNLELIAYSQISSLPLIGGGLNKKSKTVHFFLDDYRFEKVWDKPQGQISKLKQYKQVLGPNFSMYSNMPKYIQQHNHFKSLWCSAYWQLNGLVVIPTVNWSSADSFNWCFNSIEKGCIVATSTVGISECEEDFMLGFKAMVEHIKPEKVINYGNLFDKMSDLVDIIQIPYKFIKSDYETF